jgi:hypothetical protein
LLWRGDELGGCAQGGRGGVGQGGGRGPLGDRGDRVLVWSWRDVAIARATFGRVAEWRSADGFGLDAALGVEHFTFKVMVVSGEG